MKNELLEYEITQNDITLNPCPFCHTDLNEFPKVSIFRPAVYGDYLKWKKENKKILGTDTWRVVRCIQCGATGPRGLTAKDAALRWNGVRPKKATTLKQKKIILSEYRRLYRSSYKKDIDLAIKIKNAIDDIKNPLHRELLSRHFIFGETIELAACFMGYSSRQLYRIYKKALEQLELVGVSECIKTNNVNSNCQPAEPNVISPELVKYITSTKKSHQALQLAHDINAGDMFWEKAIKTLYSEPGSFEATLPHEEKICSICGNKVVFEHPDIPGLFMASSENIPDWPVCRSCMVEHCCSTNCLQCEHGTYPDCRFLDIKRTYLEVE